MNGKIAVSVLIPVYNTAATLEKCLNSVIGQTMKEIEIICVDDGSNEETKAELARCAALDARIRVLTHEKNEGALAARKHLIEAARGEYTMFLDSDDEFYPQACESAYEAAKKNGADIAQFGTEIVSTRQLPQWRIEETENFCRPYCGVLRGKDILYGCFRKKDRKFAYSLWNKIYKTSVIQKTLPFFPAAHCSVSEDLFINFIVCTYSKCYFGMPKPLIRYSLGAGITTEADIWKIKDYKNYARQSCIFSALKSFIDIQKPSIPGIAELLQRAEEDAVQGIIVSFIQTCPIAEGAAVFDILAESFAVKTLVEAVVSEYGTEKSGRLAELVCGARCLAPKRGEIRRVGFFYHRMYNGGVERVLSELIPLFLQWGYETALFIEEESALDYALPPACRKYKIPSSKYIDRSQYRAHAEGLLRALKESGCDVLLYQATMSPWFLYDMLLAKAAGVFVVGTMHELVSLPLIRDSERGIFAARQRVMKLADGVQTLVRSDAAYLRAIGCNARYISNPVSAAVPAGEPSGQNVVWVGRLEEKQKRPEHAIRIMEKVVRVLPRAHMYIVGTAECEEENARYRSLIRARKLEANITMCGFCKDPGEFYRKSRLLLMTSAYETWGMVLCEAMCRGLPVVCYEMPYLETLRDNRGCVCVEQESVAQAADAVVRILKDETLWKQLSEASAEKGAELAAADLCGAWGKLFQSLREPREQTNENLRCGLETFLNFYDIGRSGNVCENSISGSPPPRQPLFKKAALYWVENGTFALIRRGMLYIYRKFRKK